MTEEECIAKYGIGKVKLSQCMASPVKNCRGDYPRLSPYKKVVIGW